MADRIGQVFGNYRLTHLLGQGGFADVYLGEHVHLNTWAAIKVLRTQVMSSDVLDFRNEARMIAHLEHPHIVQVLDFGVEDNTPFLVMAYAPGGTLRQRHPRGVPLASQSIILYVKQVASALQYAHNQKLIHRDIKPENILLGRNNEILLSDFGIALVTPSARPHSMLAQSTSDPAGTVTYMAPEQIQGKPSQASDQYALGVVVYEWLTGMPPFHGTYTEIALKHVSVLPPSLRERVPLIPPDVEKVVLTALAKDPELRFACVQAFANALEQACQRQPPPLMVPQPHRSPPVWANPSREPPMEAALFGPSGHMILDSSMVTIGRELTNQLAINDAKVSTHHAEIRSIGQGHSIVDLNSTNGTFVNEQRLAPGMLHPLNWGDTIRVGDTTLSYAGGSATQKKVLVPDGPTERANSSGYGGVFAQVAPPPPPPPSHTGYGGGVQQVSQSGPPLLFPPPPQPSLPSGVRLGSSNNVTPVQQPNGQPMISLGSPAPSKVTATAVTLLRRHRRGFWVVLIVSIVLLVISSGAFAYAALSLKPTKTLDAFCTALQSRDYQAAYTQLSNRFQNKTPEPLFASFFANISSCTHGTVIQTDNTATASLTTSVPGRTNNDTVKLTQASDNTWKIDDFAGLSALTKTLDTFCNAWQQGDYPTAYNQLSGQMQSKMTEQQMPSSFPKVSSCTYDSLTMSANGATVALTAVTASGQAENNTVSLIEDSSNNWKIGDFANLPDKTLDAFCNAVQSKDYQTAYNEFSASYQANYPESQFAKDYSGVTTCTHDASAASNGTIIATITLNGYQYTASLIKDNTGNWKIDSLVYPPDVPLDNFCTALQQKDYQTAYDQLSDGFKSQLSESQFAKDLSWVTTCTYPYTSVVVSGNTATATITAGDSSGNTLTWKATLIKDSNGNWKIDNLQKA